MGGCLDAETSTKDQPQGQQQQQQQPDTRSNHSIPTVSTVRSDYHHSQTISFSSAPIDAAAEAAAPAAEAPNGVINGAGADLHTADLSPVGVPESALLDPNDAPLQADANNTDGGFADIGHHASSTSSSGSSKNSSRSSSPGSSTKMGESLILARVRTRLEVEEEEEDDGDEEEENSPATPSNSGILPGAVNMEDDFPDVPTAISVGGTESDSSRSIPSDYQDGFSDDDDDYQTGRVVSSESSGFMLNEEDMMGWAGATQ